MRLDLELLVFELKRRERIAQQVDAILDRRFVKDHRSKLRRGYVQGLVAQDLGVTFSSKLGTLINERMAIRGHPKCILHGNAFYRNTSIKKRD